MTMPTNAPRSFTSAMSETTLTGRVVAVNEKGLKFEGAGAAEKDARAKALRRARDLKNRERIRAQKKASYLKHRETEILRKRARYAEHREQESARKKARYAANPGPDRARAAVHRAAADPVALAAVQRAYRKANAERLRAQKREYYQQHRERIRAQVREAKPGQSPERRAYMRAYNEAHQAAHAARVAEYKRANADRVRAWWHRREAAKRSAPVNDLTAAQWTALKRAYHQRCAYCGATPKTLTMDHVIPINRRGSHTARNIVPACGLCNSRKQDGPPLPLFVLPSWADLVPAIWSQS